MKFLSWLTCLQLLFILTTIITGKHDYSKSEDNTKHTSFQSIQDSAQQQILGGFSNKARSPSKAENAIIASVKCKVESTLGRNFNEFEVVEYKTQVVAGTIYLFKVQADDGEYIHLKVLKPLPYTGQEPSLLSVIGGLEKDSPLNP